MNLRHIYVLFACVIACCVFGFAHPAEAALTFVGAASSTGNSASFNVSLTSLKGGAGSSAASGDLVIVVDGFVSTADGNPGVGTAGYTEVADLYDSDSDDANLSVNWKLMSGTPDTTVSCNGSGSATNGAACIVYVWRGADQTTPLDVTTTTVTPGSNPNTSIPNPPSITPVSTGAVVIAVGAGADASADTSVTAPTGYSSPASASVDPSLAIILGVASKAWSGSGAEDPAAWTNWTSTTAGSWAAATLAIRPASYTLSGKLYSDFGSTLMTSMPYYIHAAIGTTSPYTIYSATTSTSTGAWTMSIPALPATPVPAAIWVARNPEVHAALLTNTTGISAETGFNLYKDYVTIGTASTTATFHISDFNRYDGIKDPDVQYIANSDSNRLFLKEGQGLYVTSGNTLSMASTTILGGNVVSNGTLSMTGSSTYLGADAVVFGSGVKSLGNVISGSSTVVKVNDGAVWKSASAASVHSWGALAYGNGTFVAVSWDGNVMTSTNGTTWTARTPAEGNSWRSVTYAQGIFVAVASTGTNRVMTSPDGITWTARAAAEANSWESVTYGNGKFVAVSMDGTHRVMTSSDGTTWTAQTAAAVNPWYGVAYGNGLYVAVAQTGTALNQVMTSPDGSTWTTRSSADSSQWYAITYGNGVFVAVSWDGTIMTSGDGITWTSRSPGESGMSFQAVNYANGLFITVSSAGTDRVQTSPDGSTWTAHPSTEASAWQAVAYGNGKLVAVNYNGTNQVMVSTSTADYEMTNFNTDGATWTSEATTGYQWSDVEYGEGRFVAVSWDGQIMISEDGLSWTGVTAPTANAIYAVGYGNGTFVATGYQYVWTSPDGLIWTQHNSIDTTEYWNNVAYGNGLFVAVASGGTKTVMTSPDGVTWTQRTAAENNSWQGLVYGNGLFVAVATDGSIGQVMTSPDGIHWTSRSGSEYDSWDAVAYGNGTFVAVAYSGTNRVMTSQDGITWTTRTPSEVNSWRDIQFANGLFVAVASDGTHEFMTSPDGITWTMRSAPQANSWWGIAYGEDTWVSVANTGSSRAAVSTTGSFASSTLTFSSNATTSDLTITASSTVEAPSVLEVQGDFANSGTFHNNNGELYFSGADTSVSGKLTGTSALGNVVANSSNLIPSAPSSWTAATASEADAWLSVAYGNGTFAAIAFSGTNQVMTSPDGITWTAHSAAEANGWNAITYGGGQFVAVSTSGTHRVMTSPDGITWTARTAASASTWNAITYGGGQFVAVGASGAVMTSGDGITWTSRTAAEANTWNGVTYGNGLYVAVAGSGTHRVMTSSDGITWSVQTAAEANSWKSVTYGGSLFVAVSSGGTHQVMTSSDGATWSPQSAPNTNGWYSVTYGNGYFTAIAYSNGAGNEIMTSSNGTSWSVQTTPEINSWNSVTFGNNKFVAVAYDGTHRAMVASAGSLATSTLTFSNNASTTDLTILGTVTKVSAPSALTVSGDLTVNGTFQKSSGSLFLNGQLATMSGNLTGVSALGSVTATSSGTFLNDSATWTARTAATANTWSGLAYGNGLFVAVSDSGTNRVMTSPDGITWTARTSADEGAGWTGITYAHGLFVAVAYSGTNQVMTSPDGITWTARHASQANSWYSVAYGGGVFVAVSVDGTNRVMTSPDGIAWTNRTAAQASQWSTVSYGNGIFVALSWDGTVMTSPDGINWTTRTGIASASWQDVEYGNGLFVAVGSGNNVVMTSPDGITWTQRTATVNNWLALTYGGGSFVAVACGISNLGCNTTAGGSRVMTSTDGITWTDRTASEANQWYDIAYHNGTLVAVSSSGTHRVMTSNSGATSSSLIGFTNNASTTNLTIGGRTTLIAPRLLSVEGNYANRGTVYNTGTTTFSGASSQSIAGSLIATSSFANLAFTGAGTKTFSNNASSSAFTIGSGATVAAPSSLTIAGNYTNSGTFTSGSGRVYIQRSASSSAYMGTTTLAGTLSGSSHLTDLVLDTQKALTPDGVTWNQETSAEANSWDNVIYAKGMFVAVAYNGTNRVMTSQDGITWTAHAAASASSWNGIAYGNGIFVAVGGGGAVMTSPDAITWTSRTASEANEWNAVAYGNGVFVAVSTAGTHQVMTSPDGITWTNRTAAAANVWVNVEYGGGLFVAVSNNGTNEVMTSPDGITWTSRSAPGTSWYGLAYGNGTWVATAYNDVITSPDGINWTEQSGYPAYSWQSVAYGNGLFVAVADGTAAFMTSPDGITWTERSVSEANSWWDIVFGDNRFVAVAQNGTHRVQISTSGTLSDAVVFASNASTSDLTITRNTNVLAPSKLSIAGNYTNSGTFVAGSGTTTFNGTGAQTATGTMSGTSAFKNLVVSNTAATTTFGKSVQTSGRFTAVAHATIAFPAGATSTFASVKLDGTSGNEIKLRSTNRGTRWGFSPTLISSLTYVNVKDSAACGSGGVTASNSIDSGNNVCWTFTGGGGGATSSALISSASNQTFSLAEATTTAATITITDGTPATITAANDLRIAINTAKTNMRFDTSVTSAIFGGTAAGKISGSLTYENSGATVVIPVSSNFSAGDTLTVAGIKFAQFGAINAATSTLRLVTTGTIASGGSTRIFLTSGTSWTVPSDWNSASNTIEVIGGGASGGGGGGYAKANNVSLTPGRSVGIAVGAGGISGSGAHAGNDTYLCNATSSCASISGTAVKVGAKGGGTINGGAASSAVGGAGGGTTNPGAPYAYSGGNLVTNSGGGAAGPHGAGGNGSGATGGTGDAGFGGAGTGLSVGGAGTEWDATHGSGGGSGGTNGSTFAGGNYGGASGQSGLSTSAAGAQGLIVVTYTPSTSVSATDDKTVTITGSLTLADSAAGQVTNAFSFQNKTATPIFRFKLTPAGENDTISTLALSLTGVQDVTGSNISSIKLYRDYNGNGSVDGSDSQVGGNGLFSANGENGSIAFSSSWSATTTMNYVVVADLTSIHVNNFMTIDLVPGGVAATGNTTSGTVVLGGSVTSIQHIRGGGGGGASETGGSAPAGAGIVTGGSSGGGSSAGDSDRTGQSIGTEAGFLAPTVSGSSYNEWTNGGNALASDGAYATAASANLRQSYSVFGFNVPNTDSVTGVAVKLEASAGSAAGTIQVGLSWDGGQTITAVKATSVLTTSDAVYTLGGASDLWGRSWSASELSNANFFVRVIAQPNGNTVKVDAIQVRPYHQASGGGGGGGGEI